MKNFKKILATLLASALCISMMACTKGDDKKDDDKDDDESSSQQIEKGSASEAVVNYYDALYGGDEDAVLDLVLDEFAIKYFMDLNGYTEDEVYTNVGSSLTTSMAAESHEVTVKSEETPDDDKYSSIVEELTTEYKYDEAAIEDIKIVTCDLSVKLSDGNGIALDDHEIVLTKIGGNWYLTGIVWGMN